MKWNIGLETKSSTIQPTTLLCPRNTYGIILIQGYQVNDRIIIYKHLTNTMFSYSMFALSRSVKSVRNFTCAQVFATEFWCIRVNTINLERGNHLAFKNLFKYVGVMTDMIMDGDK